MQNLVLVKRNESPSGSRTESEAKQALKRRISRGNNIAQFGSPMDLHRCFVQLSRQFWTIHERHRHLKRSAGDLWNLQIRQSGRTSEEE
jgi:hypothetical protein